jgi:hypothetical protein
MMSSSKHKIHIIRLVRTACTGLNTVKSLTVIERYDLKRKNYMLNHGFLMCVYNNNSNNKMSGFVFYKEREKRWRGNE